MTTLFIYILPYVPITLDPLPINFYYLSSDKTSNFFHLNLYLLVKHFYSLVKPFFSWLNQPIGETSTTWQNLYLLLAKFLPLNKNFFFGLNFYFLVKL